MMLKVFLLLMVLSTGLPSEASFLASTGYIAASEPIRDLLISSGWSNILARSAHHMYESSGFDQIGYLTSGGRMAQLPRYDIAEQALQKRNGAVPSERSNCLMRLLCEVGADPTRFGVLGFKLNKYMRSQPMENTREAFFRGLQHGMSFCTRRYANCSGGLSGALAYLWFYGL